MPHPFLTVGTRLACGALAAILLAAPAFSSDHTATKDGFVFYRKPATVAEEPADAESVPASEPAQEVVAPAAGEPETRTKAPADSIEALREDNARLSAQVVALERALAEAQEEMSRLQAKVQAILAVPQSLDTQMTRLYRVQEGDSLFTIAQKVDVYDDGRLWKRIYEANRQVLADPRQLRPGQELVIPR